MVCYFSEKWKIAHQQNNDKIGAIIHEKCELLAPILILIFLESLYLGIMLRTYNILVYF
ncbi:hypothetical protein A5880_000815 [Enterococcus sp. 4G2_DIV0659]|uniref:Uncharacterized protein n=1 Tax=Candidatus Enterococcus mansonii TaxID=1834181 RepID=A0A242C6N4_9ENTE|nr:hypothetical protein A5880_003092 [Enterococcus sp. 4G2_DIV0659]